MDARKKIAACIARGPVDFTIECEPHSECAHKNCHCTMGLCSKNNRLRGTTDICLRVYRGMAHVVRSTRRKAISKSMAAPSSKIIVFDSNHLAPTHTHAYFIFVFNPNFLGKKVATSSKRSSKITQLHTFCHLIRRTSCAVDVRKSVAPRNRLPLFARTCAQYIGFWLSSICIHP